MKTRTACSGSACPTTPTTSRPHFPAASGKLVRPPAAPAAPEQPILVVGSDGRCSSAICSGATVVAAIVYARESCPGRRNPGRPQLERPVWRVETTWAAPPRRATDSKDAMIRTEAKATRADADPARGARPDQLSFSRRGSCQGAGVRPWRRITAAIAATSGGPPTAASRIAATSRKKSGPRMPGVTTASAFASIS